MTQATRRRARFRSAFWTTYGRLALPDAEESTKAEDGR